MSETTTRHPIPATAADMGPLDWVGEHAEWAVGFGHLDPVAFAASVREFETFGAPYEADPADVVHAFAVREVDESRAEEDDERETLRWAGVLASDEYAFPLTVLDVRA